MAREFSLDGKSHAVAPGDFAVIGEAGDSVVDTDGRVHHIGAGQRAYVYFHLSPGESNSISRNDGRPTVFFRPASLEMEEDVAALLPTHS